MRKGAEICALSNKIGAEFSLAERLRHLADRCFASALFGDFLILASLVRRDLANQTEVTALELP